MMESEDPLIYGQELTDVATRIASPGIDQNVPVRVADDHPGAPVESEMFGVHSQSILRQPLQRVTLKFQDIVYTTRLSPKKGWWNCQGVSTTGSGTAVEKTVLNGITGIAWPGEILAMLGPSGSGKTTLLTALGGRLEEKFSGSILYNGRQMSKSMMKNTGFVTQDDILYPHLTVRETLIYAALLRLPRSLSKEKKVEHVEAIIAELGLTRCRNTIVGGPLLRGVSGGERKRVSIGHEMLINPSLLLLDEPTSGLDSTTAQRIILVLQNLAKGGRTIMTTIHQPSSRLFYMFHKVILLSEGHEIYYGPASAAMDYFSSFGFSPSFDMNPADFMLDLANGIAPDANPMVSTLDQAEPHSGMELDIQKNVKLSLIAGYKEYLAAKLSTDVNNDHNTDGEKAPRSNEGNEWTTSWWHQFTVLLARSLKERKHESFGGLRIFQVLVVAVLAGLLWWRTNISRIQDQVGLLFFFSIFWGFFPLFNATFTFPQERSMLIKERSSRMYRLSSYFTARIVGDLPMELILPTVFVIITYWMGGLKSDALSFILTLLIILCNVLVSQGLGLALGAVLMDVQQATTLASVIMLALMLAGGYYVRHIPAFISWLKYLSFSYYCYKLLIDVQYSKDEMYDCPTYGRCRVRDSPAIKNMDLGSRTIDVVALAIMVVGYRLLAYAALRRVKGNSH